MARRNRKTSTLPAVAGLPAIERPDGVLEQVHEPDPDGRPRGFSPADDNEADALALLLWAIETNGGVA